MFSSPVPLLVALLACVSASSDAAAEPGAPLHLAAERMIRSNALAADRGPTLRVNVALRLGSVEVAEPTEWGSAGTGSPDEIRAGRLSPVFLDGRSIGEHELRARTQQTGLRLAEARRQRHQNAASALQALAERQGWSNRPAIADAVASGSVAVVLDLTRDEIRRLAASESDRVSGIEPWEEPHPDGTLEDAMRDTRIDPNALNYDKRRGSGIGIYTTDTGCPKPGFVDKYMRLSGTTFRHAESTTLILRSVSPGSWIYCRAGGGLPTATDLGGYGQAPVYVISRSYSQHNTAEYTLIDREMDDFIYDNLVLTFNSAGNTGQFVKSPAKALNVVAVGNYNDATHTIASSSSWKNPQTRNAKPELSMPGTDIELGGGRVLSGTSASAPHAAAFAADLASALPWYRLRPALLKAAMLTGAATSVAGGTDRVGVGAGDFRRAFANGQDYWWSIANAAFDEFDAADPLPGNGAIDVVYSLQSSLSDVRVGLAWLTRGTWTYAHRDDPTPIGIDFDLVVYGPDGAVVATSSSPYNAFELASFDPRTTGNYRFAIRRTVNRDIASRLRIGLKIDW